MVCFHVGLLFILCEGDSRQSFQSGDKCFQLEFFFCICSLITPSLYILFSLFLKPLLSNSYYFVGKLRLIHRFSLFFSLTSLLEYNCFTIVCQFLLYNKVNQLYIYIHPHVSSLLRLSPTLPIPPSRWAQITELISLCYAAASHQLSISHLVVYICPCHSLTLS